MKVGVYLGTHRAEEGGGYTFQRELLEALRAAHPARHELVLLDWQPAPGLQRLAAPLPSLSLSASWVARALRAGLSLTSRGQAPTWLDRRLAAYGIEAVCNLTPEWLRSDLPRVAVIWDLQHRLQPYFPEVSAAGEWDRRERYLAPMIRQAAFVVTGTSAGRDELERFYQVPSERVRILRLPTPGFVLSPGSVDVDAALKGRGLERGSYLFYPAQFWPHKNHVNLLRALRVLSDEHSLVMPLVLVGSDRGNLSHIRGVISALGLQKQVHLYGFVGREELIALYRGAFALTYVSLFGPENLPPLEAFALECPVVASRVSGAEEQLGEAALLVDGLSPASIAAAVMSLCGPPLRARLIAKGRERAQRSLSCDFVEGILRILDELEPIRRCWSKRYVSP